MKSGKQKGTSEIQELLHKRDRQFETLGRLAGRISQAESLEKGLEEAMEGLLTLVGAEAGTIHGLDPSTGSLGLIAGRGISGRFACEEKQISLGECLCGEAAEKGRLLVSDDLRNDPRITRAACEMDRFGSVLSIPLNSDGRIRGIFTIYAKQPYRFSKIDRELLVLLGNQIGIAIENARRYSRSFEEAVSQERGLIAQEIHDSIAQSLAYLNLQSRQIEDLLRSGHPERALAEVVAIRQAVMDTYQDVRQLMVDFRTGLEGESDLVHAIRRYVQEFSQRTGLPVTVDYESPEVHLGPKEQVQVFRIFQEALSNVRRHACATSIAVNLKTKAGLLLLEITDDGDGFDTGVLSRLKKTNLGLKIMRERADRLHGRIDLTSHPGRGTTLQVHIPLASNRFTE